jgi:hypothetical protein
MLMSNRSAFVPALCAVMMAAASLAVSTDSKAQATSDSCLAAPKGATPAGSHWKYRIDRVTKRQCWYLREADEKSTRAAPQGSFAAASAPPADPPQQQQQSTQQQPMQPQSMQQPTLTRKTISDARAEYLSQQAREQNAAPEPRTTGSVATPPVTDDKRALGANVLAPTPLAATRWSDATSLSSHPAAIQAAAATDQPADQPQEAEEAQQPVAAPSVAPVAAAPLIAKPAVSLQMLLLALAAALAAAGIIVSLVFRIGRVRARRALLRKRSAMWDSAPARQRRPSPPIFADEEPPQQWRPQPVRTQPTHGRRMPDDRERQMKEMLARLARSAQN